MVADVLPVIAAAAVATAALFGASLVKCRRVASHARCEVDRDESHWQDFVAFLREKRAVAIEIDVLPTHGILRIVHEDQSESESPIALDEVEHISRNVVRIPFQLALRKRSASVR